MVRSLLLLAAFAAVGLAADAESNEVQQVMEKFFKDVPEDATFQTNADVVTVSVPCPTGYCEKPDVGFTLVAGPSTLGFKFPEGFNEDGSTYKSFEGGCVCSTEVGTCSMAAEVQGKKKTTIDATVTVDQCSTIFDLVPSAANKGTPTAAVSATGSRSAAITGQTGQSGASSTASSTSGSASPTAGSNKAAGPAAAINQLLLGVAALMGAAIAL
ncbi:hypothetical protein CDD83_8112 [Cordyceps sp. RAO-2017]|nr:hypothetical protein CDD83_8112 [Cordyceps sp. RAO-2017]